MDESLDPALGDEHRQNVLAHHVEHVLGQGAVQGRRVAGGHSDDIEVLEQVSRRQVALQGEHDAELVRAGVHGHRGDALPGAVEGAADAGAGVIDGASAAHAVGADLALGLPEFGRVDVGHDAAGDTVAARPVVVRGAEHQVGQGVTHTKRP